MSLKENLNEKSPQNPPFQGQKLMIPLSAPPENTLVIKEKDHFLIRTDFLCNSGLSLDATGLWMCLLAEDDIQKVNFKEFSKTTRVYLKKNLQKLLQELQEINLLTFDGENITLNAVETVERA